MCEFLKINMSDEKTQKRKAPYTDKWNNLYSISVLAYNALYYDIGLLTKTKYGNTDII